MPAFSQYWSIKALSFVDVFQGKTCHKVYLLHFAVSGMQPPLWGVSGTERFSIIYNTKLQPTWEDYLYPNFKKTVYVLWLIFVKLTFFLPKKLTIRLGNLRYSCFAGFIILKKSRYKCQCTTNTILSLRWT